MKIFKTISVFKPVILAPLLAFFYIFVTYLLFNPNSDWIDDYSLRKIAEAKNDINQTYEWHSSWSHLNNKKWSLAKTNTFKNSILNYQKDINNIWLTNDNWSIVETFKKDMLQENSSVESKKDIWFITNVSIEIPKLGILQPLYVMKIGDMQNSLESKPDKDLIDIELQSLYNSNEWYLIGWHSSWYWWDKSERKDIFKNLEKLEIGDSVIIKFEWTTWKMIETLKVWKREIWKNLMIPKWNKVIYTCHPYNTSSERLALTLVN